MKVSDNSTINTETRHGIDLFSSMVTWAWETYPCRSQWIRKGLWILNKGYWKSQSNSEGKYFLFILIQTVHRQLCHCNNGQRYIAYAFMVICHRKA